MLILDFFAWETTTTIITILGQIVTFAIVTMITSVTTNAKNATTTTIMVATITAPAMVSIAILAIAVPTVASILAENVSVLDPIVVDLHPIPIPIMEQAV